MLKPTRRTFFKWSAIGAAPRRAARSLRRYCALSPRGAEPEGDGTISVLLSLNESTNNQFVAVFKKAVPGVDMQVLPLAAAGELQTRIQTEKASPRADVFMEVHQSSTIRWARTGHTAI